MVFHSENTRILQHMAVLLLLSKSPVVLSPPPAVLLVSQNTKDPPMVFLLSEGTKVVMLPLLCKGMMIILPLQAVFLAPRIHRRCFSITKIPGVSKP